MKLLAFDDQFVADLSAHDQEDDFGFLHIVQDPEVAHTKLELGQRVGPQSLDRPRRRRRLVLQPSRDRRL
jgi:hypothetical protein